MYSKRVSIRDVARHADVSPITVSNVLHRRTSRYSEETAQRVEEALGHLNYIPVRSAVQNRQTETRSIGVVFLQDADLTVGFETFKGMRDRCRELDYDMVLLLREEPRWLGPEHVARFLDRRCDGFIFVGENRPGLSQALVAKKLHVVECYQGLPPDGVATVLPDNRTAMRLAIAHLRSLGHERIAHLGGPLTNPEATLRCQAFQEMMHECGLGQYADYVVRGDIWGTISPFAQHSGPAPEMRSLAETILDMDVTAVVCANDYLAMDLWYFAEERGIRIPDQLSITGMDNTIAGYCRGLTSVDGCFENVGRASIEALIDLVRGRSVADASRIVPVQLLERTSAAEVRSYGHGPDTD